MLVRCVDLAREHGLQVGGVIIDDPVADATTDGCHRRRAHAVHPTGALGEPAPPGTSRRAIDCTCDGHVVCGIGASAAEVGVAVTPSPFGEHVWFVDTPLALTRMR